MGGLMAKITDIEGIGPKYAEMLAKEGIKTVEGLLKAGSKSKDRKKISEALQISDKLILEWVNHADLFRVKGVGEEYSDLLEEAGVDTVPELAQRNPANLLEKMQEINVQKKLVRRLPVLTQVESWVKQAKDLPRVIEY
jgi:predicted flap endonuclease-1-like 5' DNA nuclease